MKKIRQFVASYVLLLTPGFRACPRFMAFAIVLQIVDGVTSAAYPYGYKIFIDAVPRHDAHQLIFGAVFTAVLFIASVCIGPNSVNAGFEIRNRTDTYLVGRIAELVNGVDGIDHFERPEYLRELDLLNQNRQVFAAAPQQVVGLISQAVRIGLMVFLLARVNDIFIILPIVGLVPFFADSYSVRYRRRIDDSLAETVRLANHLFALTATAAPAKEIRIFGLGRHLYAKHEELATEVNAEISKAARTAFLTGSAGWICFAATFVVAIAIVVIQAAHGHATVGEVVMAVAIVNNLQGRLGNLVGSTGQMLQARKTAERYMWLEDHVRSIATPEVTAEVPASIGYGIDFDHVTFSYPGSNKPVLRDVTFHLPRGTSVAIVGENGVGKTTLIKLLTRMYEPNSGSIRVDNVDLASLDIATWRSRLGAIFQDFGRYEFRAGRTVGVGDLPNVDDDEAVVSALERSGGRDVLDALPAGLGTRLGRSFVGGQELSGGQWQKLALGRGRMRIDPLVLVLDEPTSSLDAQTEHAVFEQYVAAAHASSSTLGTITLLVSHRFSTVRMADLIIVIQEGVVTEVGSHAELIRAGGHYAELFDLQQRAYQ